MWAGVGSDDTREAGLESTWHRVRGLDMHSRRACLRPRHVAPPVVLVHGQVVSSRYMTPLLRRLGREFPVACPDLPGFGRSDKPRRVFEINELADALAAWMEEADIDGAVLLGNSLGCQIAVECALRHPERVIALVLQAPTPDPSLRSAGMKVVANVINGWREESPGIGPMLDYLQAGPLRAIRTARFMLADPIEDKLAKVQIPTLVIRGAKDTVVTQGWAESAARLLPRGELRVVPGAAHTMVTVAALELTRLATAFILGLPPKVDRA